MADPSIPFQLSVPQLPYSQSVSSVDPAILNDLITIYNAIRTLAINAGTGGGAGTVTHTVGALTAFATVVGNGGADIYTPSGVGTLGQVWMSNGAGVAPSMQDIPQNLYMTRGQTVAYISLPLTL